ncbi:MAG: transposase [Thiofilum sp.]|nr:transposase [Thiofilum sp.]
MEDAGHTLLFLLPYSPDLNPIEHKWAQAKAHRRRTGLLVEELFALPLWSFGTLLCYSK